MNTMPHPISRLPDETPGSDPPYLGIDPGLVDPLKSGLEQARIPPPSPAGSPEFWTHVIR
jgi:hypothetical protein